MNTNWLTIDGSHGEGGGQILRTSLALSVITGRPIKIDKIRAGRSNPGLRKQHLVAVRAAAEVGQGDLEGDEIGSREISFVPGEARGGTMLFDIGSAGSTTLVLQTILPPLMIAKEPSTITLRGGTHNPFAPPVDFLERAFLPQLRRIGPDVSLTLNRHGFYPAGGGELIAHIQPADTLQHVKLLERGKIRGKRARAIVANLPTHIGERETKAVSRLLGFGKKDLQIESVESNGPGNALLVDVMSEHVTEVFTGIGDKGVSAEDVGKKTARKADAYLQTDAPVGEYLADQLLLPMALAGGGTFRTLNPSLHTRTNAEVIALFLPIDIAFDDQKNGTWRVTVHSRAVS